MLNRKSLKYNYHEADLTVLEGVLARGDCRVAAVVEEVYYKERCHVRFLGVSISNNDT